MKNYQANYLTYFIKIFPFMIFIIIISRSQNLVAIKYLISHLL